MTRLVLYATLGLLLSAIGLHWDTAEYWSMIALFITSDYLARKEGQDHGIWITITLPADKLAELKKQLDKDIKDLEQ
jgi:hypothetical protein